MSTKNKVLKVYLPTRCLAERSGILIGCEDAAGTYCYVMGSIASLNVALKVENYKLFDDSTIGIVGLWENNIYPVSKLIDKIGLCLSLPLNRKRMISVKRSSLGKLSASRIGSESDSPDWKTKEIFVIVLVDFEHFVKSSFLTCTGSQVSTDISRSPMPSATNIEIISLSIGKFTNYAKDFKSDVVNHVVDLTSSCRKSCWSYIASQCFVFTIFVTTSLLHTVSYVSRKRAFHSLTMNRCLLISAVTRQLRRRHLNVQNRLSALSDMGSEVTPNRQRSISFTNIIITCMIDVLIGVVLMIWLLRGNRTTNIAGIIITWAEIVASECERLLHWMMGAPAGLKLNEPLTQFLGNFFLYHIYLWRAYLKALQPLWVHVLEVTCLTGCLGLTVQLSVIQDLISMMTLHIYCFYVYAARLYSLQLYALSSLWRLFCGRKWNVLRKRVDSATYDVDQLFTGTLLFTILLFLLPTTALYYAVFALLRILVLVIQGLIYKVVSVFNHLSVYWLFLRLFAPFVVASESQLSVIQSEPLCLQLHLKPTAISELLCAGMTKPVLTQLATDQVKNARVNNSWRCLCRKLLVGQLIYPWIDQNSWAT